jgi:hypothetical protein
MGTAAVEVRIGPAAAARYMGEAEAGSTVLYRTPIGPNERATAIARSGRGRLSPEGWPVHNGLRVSDMREEMSTVRWVAMSELRKSVARQSAWSSAWLNATLRSRTQEWS